MKLMGDWEQENQIYKDFQLYRTSESIKVLFGFYWYECYQGTAYVLFKQDGKLFEVEGNHCSCNGLEGQWEPTETSLEALKHRIENGYFFDSWDDEDSEDTREKQIKAELRRIVDYESI